MSADVRSAHPADDDALIHDVGAMLHKADPIPGRVQDAACALLTCPTLEDELDELLPPGAAPRRPAAP
jgi:hypothetical protein